MLIDSDKFYLKVSAPCTDAWREYACGNLICTAKGKVKNFTTYTAAAAWAKSELGHGFPVQVLRGCCLVLD